MFLSFHWKFDISGNSAANVGRISINALDVISLVRRLRIILDRSGVMKLFFLTCCYRHQLLDSTIRDDACLKGGYFLHGQV